MTFDELLSELGKIPCQEKREWGRDYCEFVVGKNDLERLTVSLQAFFGKPFKPENEKPSRDAAQYSEPFGGIQSNQIMYCQKNDQSIDIALIWPWGSGLSLTVKVIRGADL
jgi:hypothetical protein